MNQPRRATPTRTAVVLGYCSDLVISDVLALVDRPFILHLDFCATVLAIATSCINPNDFYIFNVI
jgi:hypothetical protein